MQLLPRYLYVAVIALEALSPRRGDAAFERVQLGARPIALGAASIALGNEPWCVLANPGLVSSVRSPVISVFFAPQPFGISGLARSAVVIVDPLSFGSIGLAGSTFGFDLYRETVVTATVGAALGRKFRAGVSAEFNHLRIQGYGSASTAGFSAGMVAQLNENLSWAAAVCNINRPLLGRTGEPLPQTVATGILFQPVREGFFEIDLYKDIRYSPEVHVGAEYTILETLALRAGSTTELSTYSAGAGVSIGPLRFDYAATMHRELGLSHHISVTAELGFF